MPGRRPWSPRLFLFASCLLRHNSSTMSTSSNPPDPHDLPSDDIVPPPYFVDEQPMAPPQRKGCTKLAWLFILALVALMALRSATRTGPEEEERTQDIL